MMDDKFKAIDDKFDVIHERLNKISVIEKEIQQLNIRMAVMESRLNDMSTNVTHLIYQLKLTQKKLMSKAQLIIK